ncbi:hypothetical protein HZA57_03135 [Candidatus Poribacteria bacterium]|nr:hypothetical protein [Candidatus Poribacteria bacterium]
MAIKLPGAPWLLLFAFVMVAHAAGQTPSATPPPLPGRLDVKWILTYEQAWGVAGLYVDEPPSAEADAPAQVREALLDLTLAARNYAERHPDESPTPGMLEKAGLLEKLVPPPEGAAFVWSPETKRFLCTLGGEYDLVAGALAQIEAAEDYRRTVAAGSSRLEANWQKLLDDPETPELIRREIETRQYALRSTQAKGVRDWARIQELLQQLSDAIELAVVSGQLDRGQPITMQDVGRTGLIDTLEALPRGAQYRVTVAGAKPSAMLGAMEIQLDPGGFHKMMRAEAQKAVIKRNDYAPAIAFLARYEEGPRALELMDEAITLWPDVPSLRVQRLAILAQSLRVEDFTPDLDYLLARFPAAPILLEVDMATRKGPLAHETGFRATIARMTADIRPEVLNLQLLALRELALDGQQMEAQRIRRRLLDRHPGYEPLMAEAPAGTPEPVKTPSG